MNIIELFDSFVASRTVTLRMNNPAQIESLRVSFSKRFKKYRKQMDDNGFLAADLEAASVCVATDKEAGTVTFTLKPRQRQRMEYTLLVPTTDPNQPTQQETPHE